MKNAPRLPNLPELRLRENQLFLVLTIVTGVLAGLAAVLFSLAIDFTTRWLFGLEPSSMRLFLIPGAVSLVTGLLLATVFPDVRGSGVPQTEAAFHLHNGNIPLRVPIGKFLTAVLCIGSGHSMGREGPSVQIGAGIGAAVGRWVRLPPARIKMLIPAASAGALSAAFNTPVAAVIFALEEIMGDMNASLLGSTVVASVASVIVARSILGNEPLFRVPTYQLVHPAELGAYALLGLVGGVVSLVFCKGLLALRGWFKRMPGGRPVLALQPAMGGLVIGALIIVVPEVMGVGYDYIDQALNGGLVLQTLVLLCLMKLVATTISYSSGNAGGIFAPSLYIGAMAGGAVGTLVNQFAPFPTADVGAYALVGMGTLFAGIIRAPMTSVFMIFEITQDYQILVPLMVANLLSYVISRRYQPTPVYHALLEQDDIHLPSPAARVVSKAWTARDVMTNELPFVPATSTVGEAWDVANTRQMPALVGERESLLGVVTRAKLAAAMAGGRGDEPVTTLIDDEDEILHAHPDHPLDVVLERLAQSDGLLPILDRRHVRRVDGGVTMEGLIRNVGERRSAHDDAK